MLGALVLASAVWTPAATARVRDAIDAALGAATLRGAHVGILAVDAQDGAPIYARDDADAFVPASTFKLIAGSAALDELGDSATFSTDVLVEGTTIYLRGGGDALLSVKDLDAAAAAVAATGATSFQTLAGDDTRYAAPRYPGGWSIDDLPYGYAAVPSALSLEENVVHVVVVPADAAGDPAGLRVQPASGAFTFENRAVTGAKCSGDTTDVERPWDRPLAIRIVGSYPLGAPPSDDLEPAVPDPPAYALDVFEQALRRHGVAVGAVTRAPAPAGAVTVWHHDSAPLRATLPQFWGDSDNLMGELLLLELGTRSPAPGEDTRERGAAAERRWLASIGIDASTLTIADGSGLSSYDRTTPRDLVAILQHDWHGPYRELVLDALPLAGSRGTLEESFAGTPLAGAVYAKTGTVNHVRALAGYLRTPHAGTVTFALLIDGWMDASPGAAQALEAVRERVLEALMR